MSKFKEGDLCVAMGTQVNECFNPVNIGDQLRVTLVDDDKDDDKFEQFYYVSIIGTGTISYMKESSLQFKSEYDKAMQNKTEPKRVPFDLERAKKGDKISFREDIGEFFAKIHNQGEDIFLFKLSDYGHGLNEYIMTMANGVIYHGLKGQPANECFFMAPVERQAYCIALRNRNDGNIFMASKTSETFDHAELRYAESFAEYFDLIAINKISWIE